VARKYVRRRPYKRKSVEERFWGYVTRGADDECWLWSEKNLTRKGYGHFAVEYKGKRYWRAHRVSWAMVHGHPPDGALMLHKCDTPRCVNPRHLFLGDAKANADDCKAKGRSWFGRRNGRAKLTEDAVRYIRSTAVPAAELAQLFGVHYTTIQAARSGKKWPHIN
jgi:hypothetical protein